MNDLATLPIITGEWSIHYTDEYSLFPGYLEQSEHYTTTISETNHYLCQIKIV